MRRVLLISTAVVLIAAPAFAQLVVIDPANLYQAILIGTALERRWRPARLPHARRAAARQTDDD
jgi:hypothetical protein